MARQIELGQWLAIAGVLLGPASVLFVGVPGGNWLLVVPAIVVAAVFAYGIAKGWRLLAGFLALLSILQLLVWLLWLFTEPELAHPIAPVIYGLILGGLWLSRARFQRNRP